MWDLLRGLSTALDTNSHEGNPGATEFKSSLRGKISADPSCTWATLCHTLGTWTWATCTENQRVTRTVDEMGQTLSTPEVGGFNWPAGALTAALFPALGTIKRDWMKEPSALTMSLNTLVECCFMSYDWQNELGEKVDINIETVWNWQSRTPVRPAWLNICLVSQRLQLTLNCIC